MNPQKMGQFPTFEEKKSPFFCLAGKKRILFDANHLLGMGKFVQKSRKERKVLFNLHCCRLQVIYSLITGKNFVTR
jgi:hypothetical protein